MRAEDRTSENIAFLLERICQSYRTSLLDLAYKENLSSTQIEILGLISFLPDPGVSQISEELNLSKATVSESIKRLVEKGLVVMKTAPDDRRKRHLRLTPKGRRLTRKLSRTGSTIAGIVDSLPAGEKRDLYRTLLKVAKELNDKGLLKVIRICPFCSNAIPRKGKITCKITNRQLHPDHFSIYCPHFQLLEC